MNTKVCMSKEMVERHSLPMNNNGNCTEKRGPLINSKMKISFTCANPPSSGDGEFTFSGNTAFAMTMNTTSTISGKSDTVAMASTGRWLGADCGAIRPRPVVPKAK